MKSIFSKPLYLGAATRSPIGKFGGSLSHLSAPDLAGLVLRESLRNAPEAAPADFVILGHARQAGCGPNPARQATISAGLSESVPAFTVNQACASGLLAIISGLEKIALGKARSVWAGGVESMSNTPYFLHQARWGQKMGMGEVTDGMRKDGFFCPMSGVLMGETVETFLAKEMGISRSEQDAFALSSQQKAAKAWQAGLFDAEVRAIAPSGRFPGLKDDEHRREDTTLASLAKLPAVFDAEKGSLTAGNSSGITDGAAFVHLSDTRGSDTLVEVIDFETTALNPRLMGLGPVSAIQNLLKRQNLKASDLAAIELNEAFAAQIIACQRELQLAPETLNQRGGAIALGHPIGATGTRITVSLSHILKAKPGSLGIAALCVSGGMGVAILLKAV